MVTRDPCDRDRNPEERLIGISGHLTRWPNHWQQGFREIEFSQNISIPLKAKNIEEKRSGGIRVIRNMHLIAGKPVKEPGIHRSKG